jgi:hypothetical protein
MKEQAKRILDAPDTNPINSLDALAVVLTRDWPYWVLTQQWIEFLDFYPKSK